MEKELIYLVGVPGSGKSTYVKELMKEDRYKNYELLCSDSIRAEHNLGQSKSDHRTLGNLITQIREKNYAMNKSMICDATHLSVKLRKALFSEAKKEGYTVTAHIILCHHDTFYRRNLSREESKIVPKEIITRMWHFFSIPILGNECDKILLKKTDSKNYKVEALLFDTTLAHNCMGHKESVNSHILSILKKTTHDVELFLIGLYHDSGKFFTNKNRYGRTTFYSHENVSTYIFLNSFVNYDFEEVYKIGVAIQEHMKAHSVPDKVSPLARRFAKYDDMCRIEGPLECKFNPCIPKTRKYTFKHSYNPFGYIGYLHDKIMELDLNTHEVKHVLNQLKNDFKKRSAIYHEDNELIDPGLPAFFNLNQFSHVLKPARSGWQIDMIREFYAKLSEKQPGTTYKRYSKLDGSLIQCVYYNNEPHLITRGTYSSDSVKHLLQSEELYQKVLAQVLPPKKDENYVSTYYELVGRENRIVLNYDVDLKLVPIFDVVMKNGTMVREFYDNTDFTDEYNVSDFEEGYVLVNENNHMLKVKTPEYFLAHKFTGNLQEDHFLKIWVNNDLDDAVCFVKSDYIGPLTSFCEKMDKIVPELFEYLDYDYLSLNELNKEFMLPMIKVINENNYSYDELLEWLKSIKRDDKRWVKVKRFVNKVKNLDN